MDKFVSLLNAAFDKIHAIEINLARLDERVDQMGTAIEKQFHEYMRRLEELNHAAQIRAERGQAFVSLDKYDALEHRINTLNTELTRQIENNNRTQVQHVGQETGAMASRDLYIRVVMVGLSILSAAMVILNFLRVG